MVILDLEYPERSRMIPRDKLLGVRVEAPFFERVHLVAKERGRHVSDLMRDALKKEIGGWEHVAR